MTNILPLIGRVFFYVKLIYKLKEKKDYSLGISFEKKSMSVVDSKCKTKNRSEANE